MPEDKFLGKRLIAEARLSRFERRIEKAVDEALKVHQDKALAHLNTVTASAFDDAVWSDTVDEVVQPKVIAVLSSLYDDLHNRLPKGAASSALSVSSRQFVENRMMAVIRDLGPELSAKLSAEITNGIAKGEGMPELSKRVSHVFDVGRSRAVTIGRTETHWAVENAGNNAALEVNNAGMPLTKTWLATGDGRTREAHSVADGQTVAVDQPFVVMGESIQYPGEGSARNAIQCRCTTVFSEQE